MPSSEFLNRPGSIWERFDYAGKSLPQIREIMEAQMVSEYNPPEGVHWESGTCGGTAGKWVCSKEKSQQVLLYLHGGGFSLGSFAIPLPFLGKLAQSLGITSFSVDYALAPEAKFPAGLDQCLAAYEGLLDLGYEPECIAVGGDSSGAVLALALTNYLKMKNRPLPKVLVAMSAIADFVEEDRDPSDPALPEARRTAGMYAPGADWHDPRISPIYGDFSDYPALFFIAGGAEVLCHDSLMLAERCAREGCEVHLLIGRDMIHTYPLDCNDYPEAQEALEAIVLFLKQKLFP